LLAVEQRPSEAAEAAPEGELRRAEAERQRHVNAIAGPVISPCW
jgi:hypothetical protein